MGAKNGKMRKKLLFPFVLAPIILPSNLEGGSEEKPGVVFSSLSCVKPIYCMCEYWFFFFCHRPR